MVNFDHMWKKRFIEGSTKLKKILNDQLIRVHHIGSTSIPEICAKPIIDMILEIRSFDEQEDWINLLKDQGYKYIDKWNKEMPYRRLFARYKDNNYSDIVLEHIHIVEAGDKFVARHLLFRDFLRISEVDRIAYCEMKRELVNSGIARKNYNKMKTEFVHSIDRKAYLWKYREELPDGYYEEN